MAYQTYTTEAIVCGSYARMTADKTFLLFTKDAGMLYATARSVREERSRQRYALQDFSLVRVSLVKGKSGWRIGSVEGVGNPFSAASSRGARAGVVRIVTQLRRYVRGEEPLLPVWHDVADALAAIGAAPEPEALARLERIFSFRLLTTLGYIAPPDELQALTTGDIVAVASNCEDATIARLEPHLTAAAEVSHL